MARVAPIIPDLSKPYEPIKMAHKMGNTSQKDAITLSPSPSESLLFETSKPVLEPPAKRYLVEYAVIDFLEKLSSCGKGQMELNMKGLDDCNEEFSKIQAESVKQLAEAAKHTQETHCWELLKKIGSVILAAISTVLGLALISSGAGTWLGGAMIASGILSIANLAFTETGLWEWVVEKLAQDNQEKQKQLTMWLPTATGLLCAVVGLAGSSAALLWNSFNIAEKILMVMQAAINMAEGVVSIGEGVTKFRSFRTQAGLTSIKQQMFKNQNQIEKFTGAVEKFMKHLAFVSDEAKKMIQLSIDANKRVIHQV